jgi:hypothetical protein
MIQFAVPDGPGQRRRHIGEVAAWSAPVEIDGRVEQRIWAADLDADRVERLAPEARWPYPVSADTLVALVLAGTTDEGPTNVLMRVTCP